MKHCMQDAATDLGVGLPSTKLQYTAFIKEGVPRLRLKAAAAAYLRSPPTPGNSSIDTSKRKMFFSLFDKHFSCSKPSFSE